MNESDHNIPGEIWRPYAHLFKPKEVPAKTILLREGVISKKAFYIEKGCLRSWFNKEGGVLLFNFSLRGEQFHL